MRRQNNNYLHIGMQLKVCCLVADGKVVLGHSGFRGVEAHLVTSEPSLITDNGSPVDSGASEVEVNIAAQIEVLPFISGFNFAALLSVDNEEFCQI